MIKLSYPKQIGFAVDPLIPATYPSIPLPATYNISLLVYLADLLLAYETVLIRSDIWTLHFLYDNFTVEELEPLFCTGRLRFFAAMEEYSHAVPALGVDEGGPTKEYLEIIRENLSFPSGFQSVLSEPAKILDQIEGRSLSYQAMNSIVAKEYQEEMIKSLKDEFHALPTPRGQELYHFTGFRNRIGHILDIWSTGTYALYLDPEMLKYLSYCDPQKSKMLSEIKNVGNPLDELHAMNHLPSVRDLLFSGRMSKEETFRLLVSNEAAYLREWLEKNLEPGADVRDSYLDNLKELPSKKNWTNWLKFGAVQIISVGLSTVLTANPLLGALFGIGVSALDTASGSKIMEWLMDPYHPKEWVSFIERKVE